MSTYWRQGKSGALSIKSAIIFATRFDRLEPIIRNEEPPAEWERNVSPLTSISLLLKIVKTVSVTNFFLCKTFNLALSVIRVLHRVQQEEHNMNGACLSKSCTLFLFHLGQLQIQNILCFNVRPLRQKREKSLHQIYKVSGFKISYVMKLFFSLQPVIFSVKAK